MFFPDAPLAKTSASSLPSTSGQNNDIVINKTTATSMISLDNMIDPDFEELDKGDTSKMDINEVGQLDNAMSWIILTGHQDDLKLWCLDMSKRQLMKKTRTRNRQCGIWNTICLNLQFLLLTPGK
jgi:hypothetical protein